MVAFRGRMLASWKWTTAICKWGFIQLTQIRTYLFLSLVFFSSSPKLTFHPVFPPLRQPKMPHLGTCLPRWISCHTTQNRHLGKFLFFPSQLPIAISTWLKRMRSCGVLALLVTLSSAHLGRKSGTQACWRRPRLDTSRFNALNIFSRALRDSTPRFVDPSVRPSHLTFLGYLAALLLPK